MKTSIVIADICNTLFDSNTTFDFIQYCIATQKLPPKYQLFYKLLLSRKLPLFWTTAVIQKIIRKDVFKFAVARFLRGRTVDEVNTWADEFYDAYLSKRTIAPTFSLLEMFRNQNVMLVSSTLYPVAAAIARKLNTFDFLATELEVIDDRYTGRIAKELSGQKLPAVEKLFSRSVDIEAVITDNFTDIALMSRSRQKFAVCYTKKQEKYWSVFPEINIIKLSIPNQIVSR